MYVNRCLSDLEKENPNQPNANVEHHRSEVEFKERITLFRIAIKAAIDVSVPCPVDRILSISSVVFRSSRLAPSL